MATQCMGTRTSKKRDIGVVNDDKLKFGDHLAKKVNKANKLVGLVRRTFLHLDSDMFRSLFTALIRPHLTMLTRYGVHT